MPCEGYTGRNTEPQPVSCRRCGIDSPAVLRVPGDKSLTHRALILAALADGESVIHHPLDAADTRSTIHVLDQLGIGVVRTAESARVSGSGGHFLTPGAPLDCGNSGTAARLMLGVLAGAGVPCILTGDDSLRSRPSRRLTEPLERMGARFAAPQREGFPVQIVSGVNAPIDFSSPTGSAQVKSGVLLAGLVGGVAVTVRESVRSRDHTERLLLALGQDIRMRDGCVEFIPGLPVPAFEFVVPGDPSSAAFPVVAAVLAGSGPRRISGVLLNPTRTAFIDVLVRMGADISTRVTGQEHGEPVGTVRAAPSTLHPATVLAHEVPHLIDEIPVLAVAAACAAGETRFEGVSELRVKESDRLVHLTDNLNRLGVPAGVSGDDLWVRGPLPAGVHGRVETGGDHRIAMAFAVLGLVPGVHVELSERQSPDISFPGFFQCIAAAL